MCRIPVLFYILLLTCKLKCLARAKSALNFSSSISSSSLIITTHSIEYITACYLAVINKRSAIFFQRPIFRHPDWEFPIIQPMKLRQITEYFFSDLADWREIFTVQKKKKIKNQSTGKWWAVWNYTQLIFHFGTALGVPMSCFEHFFFRQTQMD